MTSDKKKSKEKEVKNKIQDPGDHREEYLTQAK
jgi:hypothetical protein